MHLSAFVLPVLSALSTLAVASPASPNICRNVDASRPFYITAQYTNDKGVAVAKLLKPAVLSKRTFVLQVQPKGYNLTAVQQLRPELHKGRLVLSTKYPPRSGNGPFYHFLSDDLAEGEDFTFSSADDRPKGTLGLVDSDIPGQGDAGCAVLIDSSFRVKGFTLCERDGEQVVAYKRFNKAESCRKVILAVRNDTPY